MSDKEELCKKEATVIPCLTQGDFMLPGQIKAMPQLSFSSIQIQAQRKPGGKSKSIDIWQK